jgi:Skp family chaperone for outer membrane proteins
MKQRLGVVLGLIAAVMVAVLGFAGPASAGKVTATSADAAVKAAQTKAKNTCKRVGKANKAAKKANRKVKKLRKKAKKLTRKARKARTAKSAKKVRKAKKAVKKAGKRAKKLNRKKKNAKKNCRKARSNTQKVIKLRDASYFDVCTQGDCFRKIQEAADAAAAWQQKNGYLTTVRIQPGTYVEGVFLDGRNPTLDYNGMTIMGVTADKSPNPNAREVVLEGEGAKTIVDGQPQVAQNAIEARNISGLEMKNMWARNYQNNTFFVWAATDPDPPAPPQNEYCADYVMENLVSSDTRSYGLFARNCFGGLMKDSEGWNHGDSAFYIGETPCDSNDWTNRGDNPGPCQANPNWTVMDNVTSHQNVLGYSGTNSKYVEIKNSTFYNNGAGIVPNTLDSEKFEPAGWMNIHDNDIFWNNYNYYSTGSEFQTVSNGLGEIVPGVQVNYPTGIGIVLYGTDSVVSKNNNIFGHEKWGAMAFSGPLGANEGGDAKNLNNQFIDNQLGRNGIDPNATDFLDDATGGGSCYQGNGPNPTYVLGSGAVPPDEIYPKSCPQPRALNKDTSDLNLAAGIQADPALQGDDPDTVLGYAAASPPASMECSWTKITHPPFTDASGISYTEKRADPYTECPDPEEND